MFEYLHIHTCSETVWSVQWNWQEKNVSNEVYIIFSIVQHKIQKMGKLDCDVKRWYNLQFISALIQPFCELVEPFSAGQITLVALAPLTNVALALNLDPEFPKKLKEIIIMGGNIEGKDRRRYLFPP